MILSLVGCKSEIDDEDAQVDAGVAEVVIPEENENIEDLQTDDLETVVDVSEATEENTSSEQTEDSDIEHETKAEQKIEESQIEVQHSETSITENNSVAEKVQENKTEQNEEEAICSYSPQKVVSLATEKVKASGKITLTDNLDRLLAEGSITQEEYDEYYPYDGAGYYSVFMEVDLNDAMTTSGRRLKSEEEIAQYIADMLSVETVPYFLIEYAGVYTTGGNEFYEFRCYRA